MMNGFLTTMNYHNSTHRAKKQLAKFRRGIGAHPILNKSTTNSGEFDCPRERQQAVATQVVLGHAEQT